MPVSQDDIDALTSAIATGELRVKKGDREIQYRSIPELIAARDKLLQIKQQEAVIAGNAVPRSKQIRASHGGRGY